MFEEGVRGVEMHGRWGMGWGGGGEGVSGVAGWVERCQGGWVDARWERWADTRWADRGWVGCQVVQ